jgi:asparagine synthase (glutamine-hydrolysing)
VTEGGEDESRAAAAASAALGLEAWVERCHPSDLLALAGRWTEIGGDPIADPSLVPTLLVARAARARWTVALSGDGGDELTGGYPRLEWMPRIERLLRVPRALRPRVAARGPRWAGKLAAAVAAPDRWTAYQALQGVWPADAVARLLPGREVPAPWPGDLLERLDPLPAWRRYRLLDALTFLPERVLAKVDRASMSCALEVRVPLLDHRVAELLLAAPPEVTAGKRVLRDAIARLGGPAPARHKVGFEIPLGGWLRGPLAATVDAAVASDALADHGIDRTTLRRTWDRHRAGAADLGERLLAVVVLDRWLRAYV